MTLNAVCVLAAALFALGLCSLLRRRSLVGFVVGIELALGALILLAVALFDLSGMETSTGGVIGLAAITLGVGAAIVAAALHLWERRAGRRAPDLEPW